MSRTSAWLPLWLASRVLCPRSTNRLLRAAPLLGHPPPVYYQSINSAAPRKFALKLGRHLLRCPDGRLVPPLLPADVPVAVPVAGLEEPPHPLLLASAGSVATAAPGAAHTHPHHHGRGGRCRHHTLSLRRGGWGWWWGEAAAAQAQSPELPDWAPSAPRSLSQPSLAAAHAKGERLHNNANKGVGSEPGASRPLAHEFSARLLARQSAASWLATAARRCWSRASRAQARSSNGARGRALC